MLKRIAKLESNWNQRFAEAQAEHQRQLADRDKIINGLKPGAESTDDAAHEKALADLEAALTEAQERGDSKEVAKITRQMTDLNGKFWAAKAAKAGVVDKPNTPPAAATTPNAGGPTKTSLAWAAKQDWWRDTTDDTAVLARQMASNLLAAKLAEGGDKDDPLLFEEIGDEIRKRFPELTVGRVVAKKRKEPDDFDEADGEDETPAGRAPPPMLPNRGEPGRRQELTHLTQADIATMRQVNLDPNNDKHVVQFLRSKNEVEAEA
jgi:hypothetical protein